MPAALLFSLEEGNRIVSGREERRRGGCLHQDAGCKKLHFLLLTLLWYPDAVSLINNNLPSPFHMHANKADQQTHTLHTHTHTHTQGEGGLQANYGFNEAEVTRSHPNSRGESVIWPWSGRLMWSTFAKHLQHHLPGPLHFILSPPLVLSVELPLRCAPNADVWVSCCRVLVRTPQSVRLSPR